jgi:hypothetical protein
MHAWSLNIIARGCAQFCVRHGVPRLCVITLPGYVQRLRRPDALASFCWPRKTRAGMHHPYGQTGVLGAGDALRGAPA